MMPLHNDPSSNDINVIVQHEEEQGNTPAAQPLRPFSA